MNWRIEVKPAAEKQYLKLGRTERKRIKATLRKLEQEDNPLYAPNVRQLIGRLKGDFRLRVGGLRALFTPDRDQKVLLVYAILPRKDAY